MHAPGLGLGRRQRNQHLAGALRIAGAAARGAQDQQGFGMAGNRPQHRRRLDLGQGRFVAQEAARFGQGFVGGTAHRWRRRPRIGRPVNGVPSRAFG